MSERVRTFVETRNGELATDALLQGGMGLAFSLVTFGGFWWIAWLLLGSLEQGLFAPLPLGVTAIYVGVSTWSAWRGVEPYDDLTPLTRGEAARREVEDAVASFAGGAGLETLGTRRASTATCAQARSGASRSGTGSARLTRPV